MGWTFPGVYTRKFMIQDRTKDTYWHSDEAATTSRVGVCLKNCYRGNTFSGVLWTVWQVTTTEKGNEIESKRYIGCDILRYNRNDGWGYASMSEAQGPSYYSCPIAYLDMVPVADSPYANNWRKHVRARYAKRTKKIAKGFTYVASPGVTWKKQKVVTIRVISLRPMLGEVTLMDGTKVTTKFIRRCLGNEIVHLKMWDGTQPTGREKEA